ncbi:MAG: FMN-binding protein [Oscillospiraceae bacterium]|nr:FMN-binding protein [Oscillospiraceae bacterium]
MLISRILAWIAALAAAMCALKFIARISGSKALNRFSAKCHVPFGVILLIAGLAHGILAGNTAGSGIAGIRLGSQLFTLNWGTACLIIGVLLGLTYAFRRRLKKWWMPLHRALTAAIMAVLVLHVCSTGILLFSGGGAADVSDSAASYSAGADGDGSSLQSVPDFSGAVLADGVYEGSAQGYKGTITVSVTVSGGAVTDIEVVGESDTANYFSQAEAVLDDIVSRQSLDVDSVSGATYSSQGLINAVYDALDGAVQSGTLGTSDSAAGAEDSQSGSASRSAAQTPDSVSSATRSGRGYDR